MVDGEPAKPNPNAELFAGGPRALLVQIEASPSSLSLGVTGLRKFAAIAASVNFYGRNSRRTPADRDLKRVFERTGRGRKGNHETTNPRSWIFSDRVDHQTAVH
jgi:hypothetical protein